MRVHCHKHPNEPMERYTFAFVGDDLISLRLKCKEPKCDCQVEVVLNKKMVIERGIENL